MGGENLGDLLLLSGERGLEMLGGCEVARFALPLGQRLVRDVADEVLQKAVLTALRRTRVRLDAQNLLSHEACQQRLDLAIGARRQRRKCRVREGLAEHRAVLQQSPLLGGETVEPRRDQRVQRLGHLERLDLAGRRVDRAVLDEQAAVEQHPHRLDCVEGHALSAREDLFFQPVGEPGHQTLEELLHCRW